MTPRGSREQVTAIYGICTGDWRPRHLRFLPGDEVQLGCDEADGSTEELRWLGTEDLCSARACR